VPHSTEHAEPFVLGLGRCCLNVKAHVELKAKDKAVDLTADPMLVSKLSCQFQALLTRISSFQLAPPRHSSGRCEEQVKAIPPFERIEDTGKCHLLAAPFSKPPCHFLGVAAQVDFESKI